MSHQSRAHISPGDQAASILDGVLAAHAEGEKDSATPPITNVS
ncbi:MAG TPA: hypothetical protein VNB29_05550 [Chthoniobacterales bacterium]|jgi:hypothetical protein|nr:hypothetical protein [Chthoniobacterales bacterium]